MTRSQLHLVAKPGKRDELLTALDELEVFVALRDQPGFLSATVLVPFEDENGVLVEGSWSSPEHFERWRANPERDRLIRGLRHLLVADPEASIYHVVDAIS